jgi:hypothetical protein
MTVSDDQYPRMDVWLYFFGESWDVPMLDEDAVMVPTPVGVPCGHCEQPIDDGEQGLIRIFLDVDLHSSARPVHRECDLRMALGGVNHLRRRCTCCGGTEPPDPPWASRREAALLVYAWSVQHGGAI